ncbi:hypothetical protein N0V82_002407 [Gnomoniopsis sp. IMI 355080]|nr:hypothetical protein N0V82_002407 [Gnomoniopsis sp. IMI 355080]
MASRGISTLKFVGTVSLGLLTGLSYTLSTLTVPTLLTLPSASTASRAFQSLTTTARTHIGTLAGASSAAFFLAYALSPRAFRHPYLLYTSIIVATSRLAVSDAIAPYILTRPQPTSSSSSSSTTRARQPRKDRSPATRRMEMSYDVIGSDAHSEATLDSASDRSIEDERPVTPSSDNVNGEEVRGEVEWFLKKQAVSTAVSGLGFVMAVVGIWGDGAFTYVPETRVDVFI